MSTVLLLLVAVPGFAQTSSYTPMTGTERLKWVAKGVAGPYSLGVGALHAGLGTLRDKPVEYDTHWKGFGQRLGIRTSGVATTRVLEAGLGALWGEDPRYYRAEGKPFRERLLHAVASPFVAYNSAGRPQPAYARFIAVPGSNFLSNAWRPDSQATTGAALERIGWGFVSRIGGNLAKEFLPDLKRRFRKKDDSNNLSGFTPAPPSTSGSTTSRK